MDNDFVIWDSKMDKGKNFCTVDDITNVDDDFELKKGISRKKGFPTDAYYQMSPDFPEEIGLADNVNNTSRVLIISKKLKDFLENQNLKNVEFLPVSILNHKNRVASKDYFLINPIHPQDALDLEKSEPRYSLIVPENISTVSKLVINPEKVDQDVDIFRLKHFYTPILIRRKLADLITKGKFTGVQWIELSDFE